MPNQNEYIKGRGAQINPNSPFEQIRRDADPRAHLEPDEKLATELLNVHPKTILNKVKSPDIPMDFSMNPYQGCEHGCVYCYARNTHPYWGYSAGMDFERKILVKKNAARLLEQKLKHPAWRATPIMLAGNTDCYQPAERDLQITRACLEVLWKYRHPVGLITKNSLILRDLDILKKMAKHQLVRVAISITTLDESLRNRLEPRTSTIANRLKTVRQLSENGIPVNVMMAPVIPGLNDHEILKMGERTAELGARALHYTIVRLNGDVALIFEDWIRKTFPDRADKVLQKIKDCHGGTLGDSRFGKRMAGEGSIAKIIKQQFALARKLYFKDRELPPFNLDLYEQFKHPQLKLFV